MKLLFDTLPAKGRVDKATQLFLDDHGSACSLDWEKCKILVKKYQEMNLHSVSVQNLKDYISENFACHATGKKDYLLRIALTGKVKYV